MRPLKFNVDVAFHVFNIRSNYCIQLSEHGPQTKWQERLINRYEHIDYIRSRLSVMHEYICHFRLSDRNQMSALDNHSELQLLIVDAGASELDPQAADEYLN